MSTTDVIVIPDEREGLPSASGIHRLMMCPGSQQAEAGMPPLPTTSATDDGTMIALAMETGNTSLLTDEQMRIYAKLFDIETEASLAWIENFQQNPDDIIEMRETRFFVTDAFEVKRASARLDVLKLTETHALIIDHKTGFLETTPAPQNWQLRLQALAVFESKPSLTHIRVAIVQHRFRSNFTVCDYTIENLEDAQLDLTHGLRRAALPDAPRVPGKWCQYCKAKANCPEAGAYALLAIYLVGTPDTPMKGKALEVEMASRVAQLTPLSLGFLHERKSITAGIFDAVTDRLRTFSKEELEAIGFERRPTGTTREVHDTALAWKELAVNAILSVEEFQTCCKVVIGRIEEIAKKRIADADGITQSEACKQIGMILAPAVTTKAKEDAIVKIK